MRYLIAIIFLIVFFSCKKEADVKLPETKPMPVVHCYISPTDTVIKLKLTMSNPIFGPDNNLNTDPVKDAHITISSLQGTAGFTYNDATGHYEIKAILFPILAGQKYKLNVQLSNGLSAEAETTVPQNIVPIQSASVEKATVDQQEVERIKAQFNDDASAVNYYCLVYGLIFAMPPNDTVIDELPERQIMADANHNGEQMEMTVDNHDNGTGNTAYELKLYNCSRDYFQFYRSVQNYSEGNPFTEPSLIYNNIKGGLGVFAAYVQSKYILTH